MVLRTGHRAAGLSLLGALVGALIVSGVRGWTKSKEHPQGNLFAACGGVIAAWIVVFLWIFAHTPGKMLAEANANLAQAIQDKRQLSITVNEQKSEIDALRTPPAPPVDPQAEHLRFVRSRLAELIKAGARIQDHLDYDLPKPDVLEQWHTWTAQVHAFLRASIDPAEAEAFDSYDGEPYPVRKKVLDEIADLENIADKLQH